MVIHEQGMTRHILEFKDADFANMSLEDRLEFSVAKGIPMPGLTPNELLALQKGLDILPEKPVIVETGLGFGTTTRFFLTHILKHGGELHTIEYRIKSEIKDPLMELGLWDKINIHEGDVRTMNWPKDKLINCLFIDSEHSISNALGEYMRFRWFFKANTVIGFHDVDSCPGVRRAIEMIQEMDILELIGENSGGGFGVKIFKLVARDMNH